MKFKYNDGGRAESGRKGTAGDCVARAFSIALELPYEDVYKELASLNAEPKMHTRRARAKSGGKFAKSARNGVIITACHAFATRHGMVWTPTMKFGQGCKVHLQADELPTGRIVCQISNHLVAVIDGVINDTYNPNDRGVIVDAFGNDITTNRCVYGYWRKSVI